MCSCQTDRNTEHVDLADVGWMREKWTDLMTADAWGL